MFVQSLLCRNHCYICGAELYEDRAVCEKCKTDLLNEASGSGICSRCGFPSLEEDECPFCPILPGCLESLRVLFRFAGVHRELLHRYKSGSMKNLRFFYADAVHKQLQRMAVTSSDLIVPVPPRKGKIRKTGWDQVRLISRLLSRRYGYQCSDLLKRTDRIEQKTLNRENRASHLESSLCFRRHIQERLETPSRIILLDDVFTTGATLRACGELLGQWNSVRIEALVLCGVI